MLNSSKKINELRLRYSGSEYRFIVPAFLFILLCIIVAISFSFCGRKEVDLRTLAPKDSIIYLQTNDLGSTLNALTENKSFEKKAVSKKDFSVISGMQIAVAVSGFETRENKVTEEQSVLNFKPKFTAIAETHAWTWQVTSLVESNLNDFVKKTYGNDVTLERKSVNNTERFIWTAGDGRKTFAVISDSQIFFSNDEESINKSLAAKRGETENLLQNENLSAEFVKSKGKLAFGFVSNDGIREIADFIGVSVAVNQSETANARGFISGVLPQILKNTTKEITWTAEKSEKGIVDKIFVKTDSEISNALTETLAPSGKPFDEFYNFLPNEISTVTHYSLKNPQVAFRSLLLAIAKNTDAVNAKIIGSFSNSLLSQYGVADAEGFLSAVDSELLTAKLDDEESFAIVRAKDLDKVKSVLIKSLEAKNELSKKKNIEIWTSDENNISVAFNKDIVILGDPDAVIKCIDIWNSRNISPPAERSFADIFTSEATSSTITLDREITGDIVKVLGKANDKKVTSKSFRELRFNKLGIEAKYHSDFGFQSVIIEQFATE